MKSYMLVIYNYSKLTTDTMYLDRGLTLDQAKDKLFEIKHLNSHELVTVSLVELIMSL